MNTPITIEQVKAATPERFWSKIKFAGTDDCWEWQANRSIAGYGKYKVSGEKRLAHRLLFIQLYGAIPSDIMVCHKCDNPACCNPNHLWAGTAKDNIQDMIKKGRANKSRNGIYPRGSEHWQAKLSETDIPTIRERLLSGELKSSIAKSYGITVTPLRQIELGITWKHILSPDIKTAI